MEVKQETNYMAADSELVERMGQHRLEELILMACVSMARVRRDHGDHVAELLEKLGNQITTNLHDSIRDCGERIPEMRGEVVTYLATVVASNVAVSILAALDEVKFEHDLEEFQKNGGTE